MHPTTIKARDAIAANRAAIAEDRPLAAMVHHRTDYTTYCTYWCDEDNHSTYCAIGAAMPAPLLRYLADTPDPDNETIVLNERPILRLIQLGVVETDDAEALAAIQAVHDGWFSPGDDPGRLRDWVEGTDARFRAQLLQTVSAAQEKGSFSAADYLACLDVIEAALVDS